MRRALLFFVGVLLLLLAVVTGTGLPPVYQAAHRLTLLGTVLTVIAVFAHQARARTPLRRRDALLLLWLGSILVAAVGQVVIKATPDSFGTGVGIGISLGLISSLGAALVIWAVKPSSFGQPAGPDAAARTPMAARRIPTAFWLTGGMVAALVILASAGMWAFKDEEYFLDDGVDLRKHLAGRWDWSRHESPCTDSTHVIAFSADGKVMTITPQHPYVDSTGREWKVATYDVSSVTQSRIRGAIRGETRLTDKGTPVVWDLVLFGPDEYRWHRTDWTSAGFTGAIERCGESPPSPSPRPPS